MPRISRLGLLLATVVAGATACHEEPTSPNLAPAAATAEAAAAAYTVRDLGTLGGSSSTAWDINNTGGVVGSSARKSGPRHAFLWRAGKMTDLGALAGGESEARAINDRDAVVGYSTVASGAMRAVRWQSGAKLNLGTLGGRNSMAMAVNDVGAIAGWSDVKSGARHAFVWQNGVMTDLGTLGGRNSQASGINHAGKVVGWSETPSGDLHAFAWKNGVMKDLGTNGRISSTATDINTRGQIVGGLGPFTGSEGEDLELNHPYIFLADAWTVWRTAQFNSTAYGINRDGLVVGIDFFDVRTEEIVQGAWVRTPDGTVSRLPALAPGETGANEVNDFGNIVGFATAPSGWPHAVLWRRT